MGFGGFALGLVLLGLASAPDEHVLISGRIQLADGTLRKTSVESRRFEITVARRDGKVLSAELCLFADLTRDHDWNGGCFPVDVGRIEEALGRGKLLENSLAPVDAAAQRLLGLIADRTKDVSPSRRVVGYDGEREISLHVARFIEADL